MSPEISVVMPVWNGEAYLGEAVESILSQSFSDFEFLIIDDGSTDGTADILNDFATKDSRIRVIRLEHQGIVNALNTGVSVARGEWIARMDCDDIAEPTRFAKQWAAVSSKRNSVICYSSVRFIGSPEFMMPSSRIPKTRSLFALRICFHNPICHPSVIFKKSAFLDCGGYLESERHGEDFGLWGRIIQHGDVIGINEQLLNFRVHPDSISKMESRRQQELDHILTLKHCSLFFGCNEAAGNAIIRALRLPCERESIKEWFAFLKSWLPRFKWHSPEMLLWIFARTLKILFSGKEPIEQP